MRSPWWQPFDAAAKEIDQFDAELDAVSELTLALEAKTYFGGGEHDGCN